MTLGLNLVRQALPKKVMVKEFSDFIGTRLFQIPKEILDGDTIEWIRRRGSSDSEFLPETPLIGHEKKVIEDALDNDVQFKVTPFSIMDDSSNDAFRAYASDKYVHFVNECFVPILGNVPFGKSEPFVPMISDDGVLCMISHVPDSLADTLRRVAGLLLVPETKKE